MARLPFHEAKTASMPPQSWSCGVIRELLAQDLLDLDLELLAQPLEVVGGQVGVELVALGLLDAVHDPFELPADALVVLGLDPGGLLHHHVGVHHDQPPIGVVDEPLIAGGRDQAGDGLAGQADVQHGLHHAGHGLACAGADRDQQRIVRVAELLAHDLLDLGQGLPRPAP